MKRALLSAIPLLAGAGLLVAGAVHATPRGDVPPVVPDTPEVIEARRQQMAEDMPKWLPRLVGRFDYEGVVQFFQTAAPGADILKEQPNATPPKTYADGSCDEDSCQAIPPNVRTAKGKGDCIAVGSGAGVQCVIHVVWDEEWSTMGQAVEGGVSFLGPAAFLYGFDTNAGTIRYLLLNTNGIAESEAGVLKGDRLTWTFATHCESGDKGNCRQVTRIYTPPDGKATQTSIDIEKLDHGIWVRLTSFVLDMHRVQQNPEDETSKAPPAKTPPAKASAAPAPPAQTPPVQAPAARRKH